MTTKIILRYLATLSSRGQKGEALGPLHTVTTITSSIKAQVLESNPILESFGNARTVRNDNSSRFGKFIEMQFEGSKGCLISASIETYLLEKVRLNTQAPGERNFHIFYELLAGLTRSDRRQLFLADTTIEDFRMTAASGTLKRRDGIDDADTYIELRNALNVVGFTKEEQNSLSTVISALLHMSNLTFIENGAVDACQLDRSN